MNNNKKQQKVNPLEVFRDELINPMPNDAFEQIFGRLNKTPSTPRSGEIQAGEKVGMNEILSGEREEVEKYQKMLTRERAIRQEERMYVDQRTNELRIEIQTLIVEMQSVAENAPKLSKEIELAILNADEDDASVYNKNFFIALLKDMKDKVKDIKNSFHWLEAFNSRSKRKNVWGSRVEKHGGKYLLSGEHAVSRSAA